MARLLDLLWCEYREEIPPFLLRLRFDDRQLLELQEKAVQNVPAEIRVGQLAAAVHDNRLNLIAVDEESFAMLLLELVVVLVDLRPEFDLLDLDRALVLPRIMDLPCELVLVLTEVQDPAHRRCCLRRDFHKIEVPLMGKLQRVNRRHDPKLNPILVDHSNFANANSFIHPDIATFDG